MALRRLLGQFREITVLRYEPITWRQVADEFRLPLWEKTLVLVLVYHAAMDIAQTSGQQPVLLAVTQVRVLIDVRV